jgi:hypothetical protein
MTSRAEQLAYKRRSLQLRCALQRQQVSFMTAAIEGQLGTADRVFSIASAVGKNPLFVVAALTGAMMIGPWRLLRWASQGALLFNVARKILRLIGK